MALKRFAKIQSKVGRETIYMKDISRFFQKEVREYCNGLINSHGGVIYYGVDKYGYVHGLSLSRKEEDQYRLIIDRMFGSFQPFVSAQRYRLNFLEVNGPRNNYVVMEIKVSVGELGEIYEDGFLKVYLVDNMTLIGPLHPQELKELILLKYKESLEGAEEAQKFVTPYLATAKKKARCLTVQKKSLSPVNEEVESTSSSTQQTQLNNTTATFSNVNTKINFLSTVVKPSKSVAITLVRQPPVTSTKSSVTLPTSSTKSIVTLVASSTQQTVTSVLATTQSSSTSTAKSSATITQPSATTTQPSATTAQSSAITAKSSSSSIKSTVTATNKQSTFKSLTRTLSLPIKRKAPVKSTKTVSSKIVKKAPNTLKKAPNTLKKEPTKFAKLKRSMTEVYRPVSYLTAHSNYQVNRYSRPYYGHENYGGYTHYGGYLKYENYQNYEDYENYHTPF